MAVTRAALAERDAEDECEGLRAEARGARPFHGIVTRDPALRKLLAHVQRVAASAATVLITGESGTGKELVASAIHAESPRARRPFVAFNAAAVPETLAESILFGHRRGAFTGAERDARGLFVEASGGTLFIDEVQSMSPALQGKLLRALEDHTVLPVGAAAAVAVDVRIVAAANVDLARWCATARCGAISYYRLAVVRLALPPLRERPADIPLLACRFLEGRTPPRRLSPEALRLLATHDWPGNVRELHNVMERAALLSVDEVIGPAAIDVEDGGLAPGAGAAVGYEDAKRAAVEQFQRRYVQQLLAQSGGNLSAAARAAGITRAALHRIVSRLGVSVAELRE